MQFLLKIPDNTRVKDQTADELAKALFRIASYHYNEDCGDTEAYLQSFLDDTGIAAEMELLDGKVEPDKIIAVAKDWNNRLARSMEEALATALAIQSCPGPARWLAMPLPQIYDLKKAILALDNDFYAFAEHALWVNDKYITTRLQSNELNDIIARPEHYAVITVWPK